MSLIEFSEKYATEEICSDDLWERRVQMNFVCPKCGQNEGYRIKTRNVWECKNCKKHTSILLGTAFENSKLDLRKWYWAAFLIISSKAGISAKELQGHIGVTYKTAWYINRRLREAMQLANAKYKLCGTVTVDEAYFTGRENNDSEPLKRGRGTDKSKVIVAVSLTDDGKPLYAKMQVVDNFKAKTIEQFAEKHIEKKSKLITDGFKSYKSQKITKDYFVDYDVLPADSADSKLKWLHTIISNAKAFVLGTFHGLKSDDLQLYLDEFCYRFNRRYIPHLMFDKLLNSALSTPPIGYYSEN
ncbi:MAG: IS1595 family transposase [Ruminococcus sp.]|nr:IS1595 family transposase [Ruminococcus sp.]